MTNLPRPDFIDRDPQRIERDAIARYEALTDKTLYPAQPERLLLDVLNYREALLRIAIQDAAEQNLVNYARGANLEHLGALLGVTRLQPSKARTTLRFTKDPGAVGMSIVVPAGTRASTNNVLEQFLFATETNLTIPAGETIGDAIADCSLSGTAANGLSIGAINNLFDRVPGIASVSSLTTTAGGADLESDERLRTRVKLAPNLFSVAGSYGAYLYWILTSDQSIIDAAIIRGEYPRLVQVFIYPLTESGLPSIEVLDRVTDLVSAETIRPLTDEVLVEAPTEAPYTITASVVLYSNAQAAILQAQLDQAAADFAQQKRLKLGQDIPRSQVIAALSLPGVYSVSLTSPATDLIVAPNEWANCTAITITLSGTNDG